MTATLKAKTDVIRKAYDKLDETDKVLVLVELVRTAVGGVLALVELNETKLENVLVLAELNETKLLLLLLLLLVLGTLIAGKVIGDEFGLTEVVNIVDEDWVTIMVVELGKGVVVV